MSDYSHYHTILKVSAGVLLAVGVCGCRHKDMYMEVDEPVKVRVVFDWRNAPDADPQSMALYLYPVEGGKPLRYIFSGREGGEIHLPFGQYHAICINADNTDWAILKDMDDPQSASVNVGELSSVSPLRSLGDVVKAHPEFVDGNDNVMDLPHSTWTTGMLGFDARYDGTDKTLVLCPSDPLCYYTVDIYDVEGLEQREEISLTATLSNMSDGVYIFSGNTITKGHALPFILQKGDSSRSLHGEFVTFGENSEVGFTHHLTLYTQTRKATRDGESEGLVIQAKDVSDQVHGASDPHNVHIVIHGASVPEPSKTGAGLTVDVNGWESEYHEMKM